MDVYYIIRETFYDYLTDKFEVFYHDKHFTRYEEAHKFLNEKMELQGDTTYEILKIEVVFSKKIK